MNARILVVDDERSVRESLSKVLQAEGYEVLLAENGQIAIEQLVKGSVDLVLLDIGLPVKDGWDTLGWLAEVTPLKPVIVITGRWKQAGLAAAAGADVLMEKPLDVPMLFQIIHELLQEAPEDRARRLHDRGRGFRQLPCDAEAFCERLLKGYTTPFPCSETMDPKIIEYEKMHPTGG